MRSFDTALVIIDAYGRFAADNPQKTRAIRAFADSVRYKMPIINVSMNANWPLMPESAGITVPLNSDPLNCVAKGELVFSKLDEQDAFDSGHLTATLKYALDVKNVEICGFMATQCVRDSAIGAAKAGFSTRIITDLIADFNDKTISAFKVPELVAATISADVAPIRPTPVSAARKNYAHLIRKPKR